MKKYNSRRATQLMLSGQNSLAFLQLIPRGSFFHRYEFMDIEDSSVAPMCVMTDKIPITCQNHDRNLYKSAIRKIKNKKKAVSI